MHKSLPREVSDFGILFYWREMSFAFASYCAPLFRRESRIAYLDESTFLFCGWFNVPQNVVSFFQC